MRRTGAILVSGKVRDLNARKRPFASGRLGSTIYRVHSKQVIIYVITDGRRDRGSLLARSLLDA